jgi:hypothetical protein
MHCIISLYTRWNDEYYLFSWNLSHIAITSIPEGCGLLVWEAIWVFKKFRIILNLDTHHCKNHRSDMNNSAFRITLIWNVYRLYSKHALLCLMIILETVFLWPIDIKAVNTDSHMNRTCFQFFVCCTVVSFEWCNAIYFGWLEFNCFSQLDCASI